LYKNIKYSLILLLLIFASKNSFSQCGSIFLTTSDKNFCIPKIVTLKVKAFPAGTTFEWSFNGGGYTSGLDSFKQLIPNSGFITVRVRLTFSDGSNCIIEELSYLNGRVNPTPKFFASKNVLCSSKEEVVFIDKTINSRQRDWLIDNNFILNGNDTISQKLGPPFGYKSLTMFVRDSFGCIGKKTFDSAIYFPQPLDLSFNANKLTGCTPARINFTNTSNIYNYNINWEWQFFGASPNSSTILSPQNVLYNNPGDFNVRLIGKNSNGCFDTLNKPNYLSFGDSINLNLSLSSNVFCANRVLTINHNNQRNNKPNIKITPNTILSVNSDSLKTILKFSNVGNYSIYLKDSFKGCVSEKRVNNAFLVNGPIANFAMNYNSSCLIPDTFKTKDLTKMNVGVNKIYSWRVAFDSLPNIILSSGTDTSITYIARVKSKYLVTLIVNGANGCVDTMKRLTAFEIKPLMPNFIWSPNPPCPGEMVDFKNTTPLGTQKARNQYNWTFYNLNGTTILHKDTLTNPVLSFPAIGTYKIKLRAFNKLGCNDSIIVDTMFKVRKPIPKLTISDSNICFSSNTKFKATYNIQDTFALRKFSHIWQIQHLDSAKTSYILSGDSAEINYAYPGRYKVMLIRRTSATWACIDTFYLKQNLKISGIYFITKVDPTKGCYPFTVNLAANPIYNYNFLNGLGKSYSFNWRNLYDTSLVVIRNRSILNTKAFIKKKGDFRFRLAHNHISGCQDSVNTPFVKSGINASFDAASGILVTCILKNYKLINRSEPGFKGYAWKVMDSLSGFVISPNDTATNISINFSKKGNYRVRLVGISNADCNDTFYRIIQVSDIKSEFISPDTITYCAPVITQLFAKTYSDILSYRWVIDGKEINNTNPNIGFLISRNTGPIGMDVKLITSGAACSDTLDKKGYLKVIGPIPKFSLQNNVGCEKLNVKFINESRFFNIFFLEYGDGSALDSVNFNRYTYRIFDRSLQEQIYYPKLSVIDSFGCFASFERDSVIAFKSPLGNFTVNRDSGCALLNVRFRNTTIGAISFQWDFDNNGTIDNALFNPVYEYPAGFYNPKLISKSSNNCTDTVQNIALIRSYPNPDVSFTNTSDTICYGETVVFDAKLNSNYSTITNWMWDFGNPFLNNDTSTKQNTSYKFIKVLNNLVSMQVIDNFGCKDTVQKFIYVYDTVGPVSNPLQFVTVQNNRDVFIQWNKSSFKKFNAYYLFRDNAGLTPIYNTNDKNDTNFLVNSGLNVAQSRYCYTIKTEDICNNIGKAAFPHCTILLQVDDSINKLELNWLTYEGWGSAMVDKYYIYRSETGGVFKLHDSTDNNNYTDIDLCPKQFCYYVVAKQRNGKWRSTSNTGCGIPKYQPPLALVKSIKTTVLENGSTYTHWEPYKAVRIVKKYYIARTNQAFGANKYYAESDSTGFIDQGANVLTNDFSYDYRIRAEDHCKAESPPSSSNKTILLKGKSINYVANLDWTAYLKWSSGVKEYQILFLEGNTYRVLASLDSSKKIFEYNFVDELLNDSLCFKIKAIKDTSEKIESFSNLVCLVSDPKMFVPSAFSPNKDGRNDVFIPRSILIFNNTGNPILDFNMIIYNRWGEKVFESNDAKIGWDGTYKGEQCQEGTYVYYIRGLGLDGKTSFKIKGVVTLLR